MSKTLTWLVLLFLATHKTAIAEEEDKESYIRDQSEQQALLTQHAVFPEEGRQHQQLALSLRNQKLLEAQAESRARQLQFQLQAAEALHAIRQLSVVVNSNPLQTNEEQSSDISFQTDMKQFRLLGIWKRGNSRSARLAYGEHIFNAKSGDRLLGEIDIRVLSDHVIMMIGSQEHKLSMGSF